MSRILVECDSLRKKVLVFGISIEDIISSERLCESNWKTIKSFEFHNENDKKEDGIKSSPLLSHQDYVAIPAHDLFRLATPYADEFSQYTSNGIPTHDKDGSELSKSKVKKYRKKYEKHLILRKKNGYTDE